MKRLIISEPQKILLRLAAARLHCYIGRGPMAKHGSIDRMIRGIADGHFVVIERPQTGQVEQVNDERLRQSLTLACEPLEGES